MVFRYGVRVGGNSQVRDKMLTITNLIKESFSFLLLLMELQVKDVGQRHDTLQTHHTTRFWQSFLNVKNKLQYFKNQQHHKAYFRPNTDIKLTLYKTVKNTICGILQVISIQIYMCVYMTTYTNIHAHTHKTFCLPFTSNVFSKVFCCG